MIKLAEDRCTGCFACYNICPMGTFGMTENPEGFQYPFINAEKCKFELWYDEIFNKLKKTNITQEKNHKSSNFLIKLWKNLFS